MQKVKQSISNFKELLSQPLEPGLLSLSLVVGFFGGIFPIPGVTTGIVLALCALLRACGISTHVPIATAINLLVTVLDLMLIVPFIYLGCDITVTARPPLTPQQLQDSFKTLGMVATIQKFGSAIALGCFGWLCVAVPAGVALYVAIKALLNLRRKPTE